MTSISGRRVIIITACLWLAYLAPSLYSAAPMQARTYSILASQSTFTVFVGKAGFLGGLGHDHTIAVRSFSGRVQVPAGGVSQASLELEVETKSLAVADKGINGKERAEIA